MPVFPEKTPDEIVFGVFFILAGIFLNSMIIRICTINSVFKIKNSGNPGV